MSSMRNAVQRRNHKERAQPTERGRLGLLEKKKDYSARAKDYNKKKQQLKNLRQKASERNEDEFYFGMMSRKGPGSRLQNGKSWSGTIEGDRGNKVLDQDTVRLLKTQDIGYVRTMKNVIMKEVARLEQQVVMTRGLDNLDADEDADDFDFDDDDEDAMPTFRKPKAPRKIQFLDTEEEQEDIADEAENGHTDDEDDEVDEAKEEQNAEREKSARSLQRRLENARKKLAALAKAEAALEVQKAKMAKTATSSGPSRRGKKIMVRARKR